MRNSSMRNIVFLIMFATALTAAASASTQSELNANWRGAWVVVKTDIFSGCSGSYTNNEVRGSRVSSKAEHHFAPGELATVYKLNVNRKQVEVLVNLPEPLLAARIEGPFTLYDELHCKVELQIKFPGTVSRKSTQQIEGLITETLERHNSAASAENSTLWNRREREPYPDDYEATLYEYEHWRIERANASIAAKIDDSVEEAARLVDRLDDDPDYLEGFAEGVHRARKTGLDKNCDHLMSMSLYSFVKSGSSDDVRPFRDGFREGQELVFYLEMARRLKRCFVPPPL